MRGDQTLKNCHLPDKALSTNCPAAQAVPHFFYFFFSEKLSLVVISGSVDSQTASALTFVFYQLKSFPGHSFHFCQHKSLSVFSLFSLGPETLSKLSKTLRASECDFSEPSKIKVVSSAYWLNLISVSLTNKPFMSAFSGLLFPEFRLK